MTQRGNAQNDGRNRGAGPDGRPKAAPTRALFRFRRGGLWPPADPRRDTHHPGGGRIERPLFSVPSRIGRKGRGWSPMGGERRKPPRCHENGPGLKSPFFFGSQKPFLFPAGKKKWVLKPSLSSPHPERLPQSPSVTAPSEREPKTGVTDSSPSAQNDRGKRGGEFGAAWPAGDLLPQPSGDDLSHLHAGGPRLGLVLAKSALLCFRLTAKTRCAPLLVLSGANPLRWALLRPPPGWRVLGGLARRGPLTAAVRR